VYENLSRRVKGQHSSKKGISQTKTKRTMKTFHLNFIGW